MAESCRVRGADYSLALQMEGSRTPITADEIPSFFATVTTVMVDHFAIPPVAPCSLPHSLSTVALVAARRGRQGLDLLKEQTIAITLSLLSTTDNQNGENDESEGDRRSPP